MMIKIISGLLYTDARRRQLLETKKEEYSPILGTSRQIRRIYYFR